MATQVFNVGNTVKDPTFGVGRVIRVILVAGAIGAVAVQFSGTSRVIEFALSGTFPLSRLVPDPSTLRNIPVIGRATTPIADQTTWQHILSKMKARTNFLEDAELVKVAYTRLQSAVNRFGGKALKNLEQMSKEEILEALVQIFPQEDWAVDIVGQLLPQSKKAAVFQLEVSSKAGASQARREAYRRHYDKLQADGRLKPEFREYKATVLNRDKFKASNVTPQSTLGQKGSSTVVGVTEKINRGSVIESVSGKIIPLETAKTYGDVARHIKRYASATSKEIKLADRILGSSIVNKMLPTKDELYSDLVQFSQKDIFSPVPGVNISGDYEIRAFSKYLPKEYRLGETTKEIKNAIISGPDKQLRPDYFDELRMKIDPHSLPSDAVLTGDQGLALQLNYKNRSAILKAKMNSRDYYSVAVKHELFTGIEPSLNPNSLTEEIQTGLQSKFGFQLAPEFQALHYTGPQKTPMLSAGEIAQNDDLYYKVIDHLSDNKTDAAKDIVSFMHDWRKDEKLVDTEMNRSKVLRTWEFSENRKVMVTKLDAEVSYLKALELSDPKKFEAIGGKSKLQSVFSKWSKLNEIWSLDIDTPDTSDPGESAPDAEEFSRREAYSRIGENESEKLIERQGVIEREVQTSLNVTTMTDARSRLSLIGVKNVGALRQDPVLSEVLQFAKDKDEVRFNREMQLLSEGAEKLETHMASQEAKYLRGRLSTVSSMRGQDPLSIAKSLVGDLVPGDITPEFLEGQERFYRPRVSYIENILQKSQEQSMANVVTLGLPQLTKLRAVQDIGKVELFPDLTNVVSDMNVWRTELIRDFKKFEKVSQQLKGQGMDLGEVYKSFEYQLRTFKKYGFGTNVSDYDSDTFKTKVEQLADIQSQFTETTERLAVLNPKLAEKMGLVNIIPGSGSEYSFDFSTASQKAHVLTVQHLNDLYPEASVNPLVAAELTKTPTGLSGIAVRKSTLRPNFQLPISGNELSYFSMETFSPGVKTIVDRLSTGISTEGELRGDVQGSVQTDLVTNIEQLVNSISGAEIDGRWMTHTIQTSKGPVLATQENILIEAGKKTSGNLQSLVSMERRVGAKNDLYAMPNVVTDSEKIHAATALGIDYRTASPAELERIREYAQERNINIPKPASLEEHIAAHGEISAPGSLAKNFDPTNTSDLRSAIENGAIDKYRLYGIDPSLNEGRGGEVLVKAQIEKDGAIVFKKATGTDQIYYSHGSIAGELNPETGQHLLLNPSTKRVALEQRLTEVDKQLRQYQTQIGPPSTRELDRMQELFQEGQMLQGQVKRGPGVELQPVIRNGVVTYNIPGTDKQVGSDSVENLRDLVSGRGKKALALDVETFEDNPFSIGLVHATSTGKGMTQMGTGENIWMKLPEDSARRLREQLENPELVRDAGALQKFHEAISPLLKQEDLHLKDVTEALTWLQENGKNPEEVATLLRESHKAVEYIVGYNIKHYDIPILKRGLGDIGTAKLIDLMDVSSVTTGLTPTAQLLAKSPTEHGSLADARQVATELIPALSKEALHYQEPTPRVPEDIFFVHKKSQDIYRLKHTTLYEKDHGEEAEAVFEKVVPGMHVLNNVADELPITRPSAEMLEQTINTTFTRTELFDDAEQLVTQRVEDLLGRRLRRDNIHYLMRDEAVSQIVGKVLGNTGREKEALEEQMELIRSKIALLAAQGPSRELYQQDRILDRLEAAYKVENFSAMQKQFGEMPKWFEGNFTGKPIGDLYNHIDELESSGQISFQESQNAIRSFWDILEVTGGVQQTVKTAAEKTIAESHAEMTVPLNIAGTTVEKDLRFETNTTGDFIRSFYGQVNQYNAAFMEKNKVSPGSETIKDELLKHITGKLELNVEGQYRIQTLETIRQKMLGDELTYFDMNTLNEEKVSATADYIRGNLADTINQPHLRVNLSGEEVKPQSPPPVPEVNLLKDKIDQIAQDSLPPIDWSIPFIQEAKPLAMSAAENLIRGASYQTTAFLQEHGGAAALFAGLAIAAVGMVKPNLQVQEDEEHSEQLLPLKRKQYVPLSPSAIVGEIQHAVRVVIRGKAGDGFDHDKLSDMVYRTLHQSTGVPFTLSSRHNDMRRRADRTWIKDLQKGVY